MHHSQFIHIKSMAGELIFSQKRRQLGCTITTKELIFQQPHATYHVLLDDIVGMVPFHLKSSRNRIGILGEAACLPHFPQDYYKIIVRTLHIVKRHGILAKNNTSLIVPLNGRFIDKLEEHSNFTILPVQDD